MSHDWSNQRKRRRTSNYSYHLMLRPWQSLTASYIKWLFQCTNIDIQSNSRNLTSCELWKGVDWPRTIHIMLKFSWTNYNIFLRRLFAFTFSCLRFYKETVSVKLRQIELNVKLFVWLFSLKMAKKIRRIKEIKCKWKECLGSLEGTKLFLHNISKTTRVKPAFFSSHPIEWNMTYTTS